MGRKASTETLKEIEKFEQIGFIRPIKRSLLRILRKNPNMRIFRGTKQRGISSGSSRYSIYDFFGEVNLYFLYDIRKKDEFLEYLYSIFNNTNPNASPSLICAFGHLLSQNYLKPKYMRRRNHE